MKPLEPRQGRSLPLAMQEVLRALRRSISPARCAFVQANGTWRAERAAALILLESKSAERLVPSRLLENN